MSIGAGSTKHIPALLGAMQWELGLQPGRAECGIGEEPCSGSSSHFMSQPNSATKSAWEWQDMCGGQGWERLRAAGARVQLPLDVSHSLLQGRRPSNARKIPEKPNFCFSRALRLSSLTKDLSESASELLQKKTLHPLKHLLSGCFSA